MKLGRSSRDGLQSSAENTGGKSHPNRSSPSLTLTEPLPPSKPLFLHVMTWHKVPKSKLSWFLGRFMMKQMKSTVTSGPQHQPIQGLGAQF